MDWKSIVGPVLQSAAPKLAKGLLGQIPVIGPMAVALGGQAIDDAIGGLIANALGVDATPEAVNAAIQTRPSDEVVAKLKGAEAEAEAKWPALAEIAKAQAQDRTEQSRAINETIREEISRGVSWWHWRHLIGYVTVYWGVLFGAGGAKLMFFGGDIGAFTALVTAATPVFLALCALNGYVAADSTNRVNTAITGEHSAGGIMNTIRGAAPAAKPAARR